MSLRTRLRSLFLWGTAGLGAFALALILTFLLVTQWRSGDRVEHAPSPALLAEARLFRSMDNRLAGLVEGYLGQVALDSPGPTPAAEAWISRTFTALVREFQEDLHRSGLPESPASAALQRAALRLQTMAKLPRDRTLRTKAVEAAREAIGLGETRIREVRAQPFLGEPARVLGF